MVDIWSRVSGGKLHSSNRKIFGVAIPDAGLSELIARNNRTGQGGSDLIPNLPKPGQVSNSPTMNQNYLNINKQYGTPNVNVNKFVQQANRNQTTPSLSPTGGAPSGESPSGGYVPPATNPQPTGDQGNQGNNPSGDLFENAPPPPDYDSLYGNPYREAIAGMDDFVASLQASYPTEIQGYETEAEQNKTKIKNALTGVRGNIDTEKTTGASETEEAKNAARRAYAEIQQGVQARYGSTTGTGAFVEALAGRETIRSLAQADQQLSRTKFDLETYFRQKDDEARQQIDVIDQNTKILKQKAKQQLEQNIAEIKSRRADYGIRYSDKLADSFKEYQKNLTDINARNTAFKQSLEKDRAEATTKRDLKLMELSSNQYKSYATSLQNELKNLLSLVNSGSLSPKGMKVAEQKLGLSPGAIWTPRKGQPIISPEQREAELDKLAEEI